MFNLDPNIDINPEELQDELRKIVETMKKQNPDMTKEELAEQERVLYEVIVDLKTPAAAMGFSPQFIESLYAVGYQAFQGGDYDTAFPIFKLLSHLDNDKPRYLAGMASIYYAKKEWEKAQYFFVATSLLDPEDPLPYYYAAECAIEKKDLVEALFYFRGVIARASQHQQYAPLVQRVKLAIENIESIIPMEKRNMNDISQ